MVVSDALAIRWSTACSSAAAKVIGTMLMPSGSIVAALASIAMRCSPASG